MKGPWLSCAAAVLLTVLGLPAMVGAHLIAHEETLSEAIQAATAIVQASVESEESGWHSDRWGNHIYTTYTFRAGRSAKASVKENPFTIRVMGGQVGEVTEEVSPGWRFAVGQELVLFLRNDSEGILRIRRAQLVTNGHVFVQGLQVPAAKFLDAIESAAADASVDLLSLLAAAASRSAAVSEEPKSLTPRLLGTFLVDTTRIGSGGTRSQTEANKNGLPKSGVMLRVSPMASTATIADAWWTNVVNRDGDLYWFSATLVWDPDVVGGGSLNVFEKVYCRYSLGGSWVLLGTTAAHTISDTGPSDTQGALISLSVAPDIFDFGIEIYQAGALYPDYVRQCTNDASLCLVPMEGAAYDAPAPVITSISPGKAAAGTGSTVTITGTDFLPSRGNGRVDFFFQNGEPTIPAVIQSWSDTQIVCEVPVGLVPMNAGGLYRGSAGSGPVVVTTDVSKTSVGHTFLVFFGWGQRYWGGANPTVQYYVGQNLAANYVSAVQSAGGTWTFSAGIRFVSAGTTSNTVVSSNGSTEVMLGPLPPDLPSGVIAFASCWDTSGVITECDLLLNSLMPWSTATPTPTGSVDVETITLHEMGHWLELRDLYGTVDGENDPAKVMYGLNPGGPAGMKRSLHADDIAGAQWIYGLPVQCSYSISPTQQSFSSAAGTGNVSVFAGPGCSWNATSNVAWVTVTGGASGSGNGTVGYSVAANSGGARSGTVTIAGQTFTVDQAAQPCTYSISPTQQSFPASGGTGSVSVTAGAGCGWTATSNVAWVTVTSGASGTGNGTVGYSVAANAGGSRSGTVTIAGQTFTVLQLGAGGILAAERSALIDLYNSTNGAAWTRRDNWRNASGTDFNDPATECSWYGVTCDGTGVTVKRLVLDGNNLAGPLPTTLANLTNLDTLYLSSNQLTGAIPSQLGNITSLKYLTLYRNQLTGAIPPQLGNLTNLQDLWLYSNQLSGAIPPELGNLINLRYLVLYWNQLTGSIPAQLGNLTNLDWLHLMSNQLTGSIPAQLGNLTKLTSLHLEGNELTGSIPTQLGNLTSLSYLWLQSNQLTGAIPPELGNLTHLVILNLGSNQFAGAVPPQLGNLTNLEYLYLQSNQLTGTIPPQLGNLTNLIWLLLYENRLTGSIPTQLGNLTKLTYLHLQGNQLTGAIPTGLQALTLLNANGGLDLRWNGLHTSDATLRAFLNSKQTGGNWENTQTVAPAGLAAGTPLSTVVPLSWTPIAYTGNTGGYQVFVGATPGGPYSLFGMTPTKTASSLPVTGLSPGTTYYFVVQSVTYPHANNTNTVVSEATGEVSATTVATLTLTVSTSGTGTGTVMSSPAGINCPATCAAGFANGSSVTLTASAAGGSVFSGWSGACTGSSPTCQVIMTQARNVTATFDQCSFSIAPQLTLVPSGGGSGSVAVTSPSGCSWAASSNAAWITITGGTSGTGNGTVTYSVAANSSASQRTGTLTIAGQTFTVNQDGVSCTYSLGSQSTSMNASGGDEAFVVTAPDGCAWTASTTYGWIHITTGSGNGGGAVTFTVEANPSTQARTGTITVQDQTFTVNQAGISCTYSILPTSQSFQSIGGTGSVAVTTPAGCSWAASSNVSWATITDGSNGTGNGTVTYSVAANSSASQRTGTLTIAGQTFTVNQDGVSCTYSIAPQLTSVPSGGGSGSVAVTAAGGCSWTASGTAAWIAITSGSSGAGNGTVTYSVAANSSASQRTGTLTIAGQTFTVNQDGVICTYSIAPQLTSVPSGGGSGSVAVTSPVGCAWTASSDAAWITVMSGTSGSGNGTVEYWVGANAGGARAGTMRIAGQTFTVNQDGVSCTYSISPAGESFLSAGGAGSVAVTTGPFCAWSAVSSASWVTITSGVSGFGNGAVGYSVAANGGSARSGTMIIAGQTFAINQSGASVSLPFAHWIAAASHVDGVGGSHWRSDLAVLNRSSSQATVEYRLYTPGGLKLEQVVLGGNGQDFHKDVASWLGYWSGSGPLEVRSDQDVFVMGRTYNQVDATHTYGQNYDGQEPDASLLAAGQSAWLPLLVQNPSFRCNIAITNTGASTADVTLALYDGQGTLLWSGNTESSAIASGAFIQYLKPFQKYAGRNDLEHAYAKVTVTSGSGIIVWASVMDEATGDPTTVFMKR